MVLLIVALPSPELERLIGPAARWGRGVATGVIRPPGSRPKIAPGKFGDSNACRDDIFIDFVWSWRIFYALIGILCGFLSAP
jgi:hypothetical protein